MNVLTSLFQQDMFLAVISYLAVGLACLMYFLYREKKWERDLAQYQLKTEFDIPQQENGKTGTDRPWHTAEIYVLTQRNQSHAQGMQANPTDDEMQVVAGESMDVELPQPACAAPTRTAQHG